MGAEIGIKVKLKMKLTNACLFNLFFKIFLTYEYITSQQ